MTEINKDIKTIIDGYDLNGFRSYASSIESYDLRQVLLYILNNNYYPFLENLCEEYSSYFIYSDLKSCIWNGHNESLDILLKKVFRNKIKYNELIEMAVKCSNLDSAKVLLENGMILRLHGKKAFVLACTLNRLNFVRWFLSNESSFAYYKDNIGIYYSLLNNNEAMVDLFLEYKPKLSGLHLEASKNKRIKDKISFYID